MTTPGPHLGYPGPPPPGYASPDEKTWALIAHFGGAVGAFFLGYLAFLPPLIAFLHRGPQSPTVRAHSLEALNFQLPVSAAALLVTFLRLCAYSSVNTSFLGDLLWFIGVAITVVGVLFGILGGLKANEGLLYRYPGHFTLVK